MNIYRSDRPIFASLLKKTVFLGISLNIALSVAFMLLTDIKAQSQDLSVFEIYTSGALHGGGISNINWMKAGSFYTAQEGNSIVKYDIKTGEKSATIFNGNNATPKINFDKYEFSADEKKILLRTETESIYRRSFTAVYYIYDLENSKLQKLSDDGSESYATFSPDGSKVAFVRENNLFYVNLKDMKLTQLTDDGKFNHIINGSADWVYEEEFGFVKAFTWMPDSKKIAYYRFDESNVKEYNMQVWRGEPENPYPVDYRFKYPKAGEDNSVIELYVHDLEAGKRKKMDIGTEKDIYIPRMNSTKDAKVLSFYRMNRLQNKLELMHADVSTGKSKVILTEEDTDGYVDIEYSDDLLYLNDGKHFLASSEKDGYKHFYLYTLEGKLVRQVTKGEYEVKDLIGVDQSKKNPVIYYTSTEVSPLERHFYKIDLKGKGKEKLAGKEGVNKVSMSNDFSYYILTHNSNKAPVSVTLFSTEKNKAVKELKNNDGLIKVFEEKKIPSKEFFDFKTKDGFKLYGYMVKPPNFDPKKKYPLLMHVYGGPSSQEVQNTWPTYDYNHLWHAMLAQKGYVIAVVDNRGTDARGSAFKKSTYGQLGKYETRDQIEVATFLSGKDFIDEERIGIWGWSYGGYMTSLCMTVGADVFKTGIAVAPVTTWRYYDTIYTERFLKRPQDNPGGYDDNSPINHADKLKGNFLLIHGTGDDNVHVQNSMILQDALIAANKPFEMFYYPNRNHGIYGGITRVHLYQMMTKFILENL